MPLYLCSAIHPEAITLPVNVSEHEFSDKGNLCPMLSAFWKHNHAALEILLITDGEFFVKLEKKSYLLKAGDCILFNAYEIHEGNFIANRQKNRYLCLTFTPERFFSQFNKSILGTTAAELQSLKAGFDNYYAAGTTAASRIADCITAVYDRFFIKSNVSECESMQYLLSLMTVLFDGHYHVTCEKDRHNIEFLHQVTEFVEQNYQSEISTVDIASELCMTPSGFCHLFRQNFGTRFLSYLCEFRIRKAMTYIGRAVNIVQIADEVGFSDYCHFSKCFKKYVGVTPAVYFGKWSAV